MNSKITDIDKIDWVVKVLPNASCGLQPGFDMLEKNNWYPKTIVGWLPKET